MNKRFLGTTAAMLLVVGGVAACGGDDQSDNAAAPAVEQTAQPAKSGGGVETASADLRAGLTSLLQEHVYLAGTAVATGVGEGLDSKAFKASADTLDANSQALADAIGSVYGEEAGAQFLELWRKHIGFFVDYTKGKATEDQAMVRQAEQALDGYRADFGAFLSSANPELTKEAVAEELEPHTQSVFDTIDAVVAGSPETFDRLRVAAQHMPGTANVLAGAIAKQQGLDGSVDSGASELRSGLTGLLQEHVYLAGIAISQGVGNGLDSKQFKASAATLDENSKGLADAIGGVYGEEAGAQFLELWRKHIGMFVDYTKAKATKDDAAAEKALADLDGYREDFGAFLASANPNLTKEAVADELTPHVESVASTIRAVVAGSPKTFDRLREAAQHMPNTAKVLSGAIVTQFPDKFQGQA